MTGVGRKADHLRIAAGDDVAHAGGTGLERLRLRHRALPERDLADVSLETPLLGAQLGAPLLVSAMTGGTDEAGQINARLARAAAEHRLALVLGSGRPLLDDPSLLATYRGDDRPPLLLGNLGAAQVRGPEGPARAERLVELLGCDGLTIHLNPVQEAVQPEGEPQFSGVAAGIAAIVARLAPLPVVVKEVGFGMDAADVALLRDAGVAAIDVAGAGGTNWALVEGRRQARAEQVAAAFGDWGVPTAAALTEARAAAPALPLIASGGLRDGVDAAKALALGATAAGLARAFLLAARADAATDVAATLVRQLRIAVWAAGAASAAELSPAHLRS
jgi:isopentenyl-diphosphate delta-isomerase